MQYFRNVKRPIHIIPIIILLFPFLSKAQLISKTELQPHTNDSIAVYEISYTSDSLKIKGFVVEPLNNKEKLPVVIFNRGGNRSFKMIDSTTLAQWIKPIAKAGYVVVASQYRGSKGSEGFDEIGGKDVDDVLNLIPVLSELPECDTTRVGMYGWSRGGIMTYLALAKTNKIKAAVIGGAPSDMFGLMEQRPKLEDIYRETVPNYDSNRNEELKKRSAVYWADQIARNTPVLIIHGKKDKRVNYDQAQQLSNKFIQLSHIHRLVLFDADHIISEDRARKDKEVLEWLDKYLKPSAKP
ncbi:MAG: S9 family peptidase [Sphingobacteriales bacterium]|nr:MAG: S9 family peptidase [Sphingobacteriales bacterium]